MAWAIFSPQSSFARFLSGVPEERALQLATAGVYEVLARTMKRGSDELTLEGDASSLMSPMALVQIRRIMHPALKTKPSS
jgi:Pyridoxal kinase (EC 2.7.1.35)